MSCVSAVFHVCSNNLQAHLAELGAPSATKSSIGGGNAKSKPKAKSKVAAALRCLKRKPAAAAKPEVKNSTLVHNMVCTISAIWIAAYDHTNPDPCGNVVRREEFAIPPRCVSSTTHQVLGGVMLHNLQKYVFGTAVKTDR